MHEGEPRDHDPGDRLDRADIAGLSREEAAETMRWSARALLRSALAEQEG